MISKKIRTLPVIVEFDTVKPIIGKTARDLLEVMYFLFPRIQIIVIYSNQLHFHHHRRLPLKPIRMSPLVQLQIMRVRTSAIVRPHGPSLFFGAAVARVALAPVEQGLEHRSQLFALLGQYIFGAWRVLLIKTSLDNPGFLEPFQSTR